MHEMSLAESVLQLLEDQAVSGEFVRVRQVWLRIGELAAVEVEALRFCLDVVMAQTLAQDAQFHIDVEPGRGLCQVCGQTVMLHARYEACPACGAYQVTVTGGDAMRVSEVEVE